MKTKTVSDFFSGTMTKWWVKNDAKQNNFGPTTSDWVILHTFQMFCNFLSSLYIYKEIFNPIDSKRYPMYWRSEVIRKNI